MWFAVNSPSSIPWNPKKRNPNQMENQILRILWSIVSTNTNCCLYNTSKYFYVAVLSWWFVRVQKLMIPRGFYLIFFNGGRSFSAAFPPSTFSGDFKPIPICCQTFLVSSKCQWDIWLQNIHIYVLEANNDVISLNIGRTVKYLLKNHRQIGISLYSLNLLNKHQMKPYDEASEGIW